jgi:hypothetical protein
MQFLVITSFYLYASLFVYFFCINVFLPPMLACNLFRLYAVSVHNVITSIYTVPCL